MRKIAIDTEFIKLDQLLKYADITGSGGEGRILITEGFVKVDGEECLQRGRKIRPGMKVEIDCPEYGIDETLEVVER